MVSRREVLSTGIVGGLGAAMAPAAEASPQGSDSAALGNIAGAIRAVQIELQNQRQTGRSHESAAVARLRDAMRPHFRSHRRFPAYIEVGWGIWIDVYDWHIGTGQPLAVSQLADGRYTLRLMQTTLILRPDVEDGYISTPFDELAGDAAPAGVTP